MLSGTHYAPNYTGTISGSLFKCTTILGPPAGYLLPTCYIATYVDELTDLGKHLPLYNSSPSKWLDQESPDFMCIAFTCSVHSGIDLKIRAE